jgi:hypothetical protein
MQSMELYRESKFRADDRDRRNGDRLFEAVDGRQGRGILDSG